MLISSHSPLLLPPNSLVRDRPDDC